MNFLKKNAGVNKLQNLSTVFDNYAFEQLKTILPMEELNKYKTQTIGKYF